MNPALIEQWLGTLDPASRPAAIFGLGVLVAALKSSGSRAEMLDLANAGQAGILQRLKAIDGISSQPAGLIGRLRWGDRDPASWAGPLELLDPAAVAKAWQELAGQAQWGQLDVTTAMSLDLFDPSAGALALWLTEAAGSAESRVGGLYFHDPDLAWRGPRPEWHWPMRVGFLDDSASRDLLGAYYETARPSWLRNLAPPVELGRTGQACDVLLSPLSATETLAALERAGARASVVVLGDAAGDPVAAARGTQLLGRQTGTAATAWLQAPLNLDFAIDLTREISHNRTLDAAIHAASYNLGMGSPLVLEDQYGFFDRTRIGQLAEGWAERLVQRGRPDAATKMRTVAASEFSSETTSASDMVEAARESGVERAEPRYLNADVFPGGRIAVRDHLFAEMLSPAPAFAAEDWNTVAAWIGPAKIRASDQLEAFPDHEIDWRDGPQTLQVVLVAPDCDVTAHESAGMQVHGDLLHLPPRGGLIDRTPLVLTDLTETASCAIRLRAVGTSDVAVFMVRPRFADRTIRARLLVLHGNRILQTAILTGAVNGTNDPLPEQQTTIALATEGVVRDDWRDLDDRRKFDLAILSNDSLTGSPQLTTIADDEVILRDTSNLAGAIANIQRRMADLVYDGDAFSPEGSEATARVLRQLAHEGVQIRDGLVDAGFGQVIAKEAHRIQLVSAKDDAFFPIEFIYDGAAPHRKAPPCPNQVAALERGACGDCPYRAGRDHVCALRFWGMRKVIERQLYNADTAPDRDTVRLSPRPDRGLLGDPSARLFASAARASALPSGANAIGELAKRFPGAVVDTWEDWRKAIADKARGLLLLVPHNDKDAYGNYLEIGVDQHLGGGEIDGETVGRSEPVLVLLLGCNTAVAEADYARFMTRFRHANASVVIGTLTPILGRHAAPVASVLLDRLEQYWDQPAKVATVGDAITEMRRDMMRMGLPVGMVVVAIGDADWVLGV